MCFLSWIILKEDNPGQEAHVINIYIFLFLLKIASYTFLLNYIKKKIIEISIHVHDIMG
jgi:hypothetical protein